MTSPINNISAQLAQQLAGLIRSQVGTLRKKAPAGRRESDDIRKGDTKHAPEDLATVVARRIQEIDNETPNPERRAFHIFLESVILAELGEHLANDPGFYQLIEDVHQQMEADSKLGPLVAQAGALLLGHGTAG
ncbi:hypothetical protein PCO31110_04729 [Pandoraea communis]|uniref:Uncharacterized protein n=1 Tax=Pandoraea communis TaxID=2508297 RepID=A0A5E4YQC5_9BURK|nr:hypothetical protein [Pandoraea communis]VVE50702.1 hypothetical protein PCO31110_04729 [Pandoraea communis]